MELGIEGRLAVVTGGTSGIGAALVERLEAEGATALAASRSTGVDVTDPEVVAQVDALLDGRHADILVNCAGTSTVTPISALTDDEWERQWALNVLGPMRLMRSLAPRMVERGWGRIVNVSSSSGKRASATSAAYTVTKTAQLSLSRVFADEYAPTPVRINAVTPGPVDGPLWMAEGGMLDQHASKNGVSREEMLERQQAKVPIGRMLTPQEEADVIAFLCSELASGVHGAAWSVDGAIVPSIF